MKSLLQVAHKFSLTTSYIVNLLAQKGHAIEDHFQTKLTQEQYGIVAVDQVGEDVDKTNRDERRLSDKIRNWSLGQIKFYDKDKDFGFVKDILTHEDAYFRRAYLKSDIVNNTDYVLFKAQPSRRKKGENDAFNLTLLQDFDNEEVLRFFYGQTHISEIRQVILSKLSPNGILAVAIDEFVHLPAINGDRDYQDMLVRIDAYGAWLSAERKFELNRVGEIKLTKGAAPIYLVDYWLDGRTAVRPSSDVIIERFIHCSEKDQFRILYESDADLQHQLLLKIQGQDGGKNMLLFVSRYLQRRSPDYRRCESFVAEAKVRNDDLTSLYRWACKVTRATITQQEEAELFYDGFLDTVNFDWIVAHARELDEIKISKLFRNLQYEGDYPPFLTQIAEQNVSSVRLSNNEAGCSAVIRLILHPSLNAGYTKAAIEPIADLVESLLPSRYRLSWWQQKLIRELPDSEILELLHSAHDTAARLDYWLRIGLIDEKRAARLVYQILLEKPDVTTSRQFYDLYSVLQLVLSYGEISLLETKLSDCNMSFIRLALWLKEDKGEILYDNFSNKFAYLVPADQVLFLRKLFYYADTGRFELTPATLRGLTLIDYEIYKSALRYHPTNELDISAFIVITILNGFTEHGKFISETDLLRLLLRELTRATGPKQKFQIKTLFEKCKGRTNLVHNFRGDRRIEVEGEFLVLHFNFDDAVVEDTKKLPGRRYDPRRKLWFVPLIELETVRKFAVVHFFRLEVGGNRYENNVHLAKLDRESKAPAGITFCEGRLAQTVDNVSKNPFWWCHNKPCHQNCETTHSAEDWQGYTLLDMLRIMQIGTEEGRSLEGHSERKGFYRLIGLINRFRSLINLLYCRECEHLMHPADESDYAHYRVVRFCCENDTCSKHRQEVYLHHCFNRKCNSFIDSRVSKKCSHGWYICSSHVCGCCCSDQKNGQRLENLKKVGRSVPEKLQIEVEKKLGHLERAIHSCYNCAAEMDEIAKEIFVCRECKITYHLSQNNFSRPNRNIVE